MDVPLEPRVVVDVARCLVLDGWSVVRCGPGGPGARVFFWMGLGALRTGFVWAGVLGLGVLGPGVLGPGVLGPGVLGLGVFGLGVLGLGCPLAGCVCVRAGVFGLGVCALGVLGLGVLGVVQRAWSARWAWRTGGPGGAFGGHRV